MTNNPAFLADEYAILKAQIDELQSQAEKIASELKDLGIEKIEGKLAVVSVVLSERVTLDQKAVKALLTAAQIEQVSKTTLVTSLRVKNKLSV